MDGLIGGRQESARKHSNPEKIASTDQKLEGINKAIEGEVNRGINSVLRNFDKRAHGGTKVEATSPKAPSKHDSSGNLTPCLDWGKDYRRFGVWAKIEQQPATKKGQKMELDTDSLQLEKRGK